MNYYARVVDNRVVEIIKVEAGDDIADLYHADLIATLVEVPSSVKEGWARAGDGFIAPPPVVVTKERLLAYAENARWVRETAGIVIGGATVATDRDSQGMIGRAYSLALVDPSDLVDYKAESGWVQVDSATLIALAIAVGRHVRACFRTEKSVSDQIEAGTITSFAEIDAAFT